MRVLLAISALLSNVGAITPPPAEDLRIAPHSARSELTDPARIRACHDRIEQVRQQRGLPMLDKGNAAPDEPLLIAAVDKRIDGCSVMVMRSNFDDIRPLPAPADTARKFPAK